MTKRTRGVSTVPADFASLWGADAAMDRAGRDFRTWLEAGAALQHRTLDYLGGRVAKDAEALSRLAACSNALDVMNVQTDYARDAFADFIEHGRAVTACLADAASGSSMDTH